MSDYDWPCKNWGRFGSSSGKCYQPAAIFFPPHIADQLALLQDKVAPFDGKLAKQQIEAAMGGLPVEAWFDDFEIKPLASASIAGFIPRD